MENRLTSLIQRSLTEEITDEERTEMLDLLNDPLNELEAKDQLLTAYYSPKMMSPVSQQDKEDLLKAVFQSELEPIASKSKIISTYLRWAVAAAAVITITIYGLQFFNNNDQVLAPKNGVAVSDVAPGDFGATLTLADGRKIKLGEVSNGELLKETGLIITKSADGRLVYKVEDPGTQLNALNTLSTARGETYQVSLPDGSLVYLNAESSLTYNISLLDDGKRTVKLKGEGYFEVAKDSDHPFIVKTENEEIEVLGTHFNVNSYPEELEKTTLLEGSVKLTASGVSKMLKPGQQGKIANGKLTVSNVDTDVAVAWKNNEFVVEGERIESMMKMIERWYNVEVIYVGEKTTERFSGGVSRFDNVSKVLHIVESTGAAHFEIKGRKIYVSK